MVWDLDEDAYEHWEIWRDAGYTIGEFFDEFDPSDEPYEDEEYF